MPPLVRRNIRIVILFQGQIGSFVVALCWKPKKDLIHPFISLTAAPFVYRKMKCRELCLLNNSCNLNKWPIWIDILYHWFLTDWSIFAVLRDTPDGTTWPYINVERGWVKKLRSDMTNTMILSYGLCRIAFLLYPLYNSVPALHEVYFPRISWPFSDNLPTYITSWPPHTCAWPPSERSATIWGKISSLQNARNVPLTWPQWIFLNNSRTNLDGPSRGSNCEGEDSPKCEDTQQCSEFAKLYYN